MCFLCVDEAVAGGTAFFVLSAPWYKSAWARVWGLRKRITWQ